MYQKNLGRQIWELFSPVVVYRLVVMVVETIFIGIHYVENLDRISMLSGTRDEVTKALIDILAEILVYSVEMMGIACICSVPILAFMMKRDRKREAAAGMIQSIKAPLSKYGLIFGISIPFALGCNNLIKLLNLAEYSEAYQETAEVLYAAQFGIQIICLGVLTPLVEELIFRGLIFRRLKRSMGNPKHAIIFSGILFGFYHGNLVQTIYGCLAGVLLAYLYEKYGSIKAPILAHVLMNLVALSFTEAKVFVWMFEDIVRMGIITVACAAIASTVFLFIQKIEEKPLQCEEK